MTESVAHALPRPRKREFTMQFNLSSFVTPGIRGAVTGLPALTPKSPQTNCGTHVPTNRWLNQVPRSYDKVNSPDIILLGEPLLYTHLMSCRSFSLPNLHAFSVESSLRSLSAPDIRVLGLPDPNDNHHNIVVLASGLNIYFGQSPGKFTRGMAEVI